MSLQLDLRVKQRQPFLTTVQNASKSIKIATKPHSYPLKVRHMKFILWYSVRCSSKTCCRFIIPSNNVTFTRLARCLNMCTNHSAGIHVLLITRQSTAVVCSLLGMRHATYFRDAGSPLLSSILQLLAFFHTSTIADIRNIPEHRNSRSHRTTLK